MKKQPINININSLIGEVRITDLSKTEFDLEVKLKEYLYKLLSMANATRIVAPSLDKKHSASQSIITHLDNLNTAIDTAENLGLKVDIEYTPGFKNKNGKTFNIKVAEPIGK